MVLKGLLRLGKHDHVITPCGLREQLRFRNHPEWESYHRRERPGEPHCWARAIDPPSGKGAHAPGRASLPMGSSTGTRDFRKFSQKITWFNWIS